MLPITGPFTSFIGTGAPGTPYYKYWKTYKQARPFNVPTEFESREVFFAGNNPTYGPGTYASYSHDIVMEGDAQIDNIAYSKFIGKLHAANADIGILFGEYKSSRDMITNRAEQLWRMATAVRRRSPTEFFRAAGQTLNAKPGKPWNAYKEVSSIWLEYSWGWAPAIEDIFKGLKTLCADIEPERYLRAGHLRMPEEKVLDKRDFLDYAYGYYTHYVIKEIMTVGYKCTTGATVRLSNPNVALANRLGVINPAGVIWAVQPFSFLVDKYLNIGQMLNSFSDLYGYDIRDAWVSRRAFGGISYVYQADSWHVWYPDQVSYDHRDGKGTHNSKRRTLGLLGPTLAFRVPSIGSLSEAASYLALTVQLLTK